MSGGPVRRWAIIAAAAITTLILVFILMEKVPMLKAGDRAPDFEARTHTGEGIRLSDYQGKKNVVLYFYPKDFTAGCTAQACSFRDNYDRVASYNAVIFGVSSDEEASHRRFSSSNNLQFPLLSDPDRTIARLFGAARLLGPVKRVTFVIDKEGMIRDVAHHELAIGSHLEDVLAALRLIEQNPER